MRKTLALLASAALMGLSLAAHATSVGYTITNGTLTGSAITFSGTFTYETTTQKVSAASITTLNGAQSVLYNSVGVNGVASGENYAYISSSAAPGTTFTLGVLLGPPLVVCTLSNPNCVGATSVSLSNATTYYASGGTLSLTPVAVAATPEPSSLILLGTGILGLAGAARRRFLNA